jgi:hypothetical protein
VEHASPLDQFQVRLDLDDPALVEDEDAVRVA